MCQWISQNKNNNNSIKIIPHRLANPIELDRFIRYLLSHFSKNKQKKEKMRISQTGGVPEAVRRLEFSDGKFSGSVFST